MNPSSAITTPSSLAGARVAATSSPALSPSVARSVMIVVIGAAAAAGVLATSAEASSLAYAQAGADLTRLLQAMALLKSLMALGVARALLWRLGEGVTIPKLTLYALAAGAMVAGPGLVWSMAYVRTGAALLHGGLLVTAVMLWRDPVVAGHLTRLLSTRASVRAAAAPKR